MPLTPFQSAIAELLAVNRSPDSYLAGGSALHIEPNSKRYSNDLDYFHDSEEPGEDVVPHYGRPGGVLPLVGDPA